MLCRTVVSVCTIDNVKLTKCVKFRDPSVLFDSRLTFREHVNDVCDATLRMLRFRSNALIKLPILQMCACVNSVVDRCDSPANR